MHQALFSIFFFFNDTATTEIYTLSLHDALPILVALVASDTFARKWGPVPVLVGPVMYFAFRKLQAGKADRSGEHTSALPSQSNHVCRLLPEKKKKQIDDTIGTGAPIRPIPGI